MEITELKSKSLSVLQKIAQKSGIEDVKKYTKEELIYEIFKVDIEGRDLVFAEGVLEVLDEGYGFLRSPRNSYLISPNDIYVAQTQIKRFNLRTGDYIIGEARPPKDSERYAALLKITAVNFEPPEKCKTRVPFDELTPFHPTEKIKLERKDGDLSMRIIDLLAPIGKGQRGLIVSPPRAGKTILLQKIANSITENHPEITPIILLVDERPEEVTDTRRNVRAEVVSSTFDESPERHVQVARMVLEKAKRLVEYGRDVVILLDSITRLARAHNTILPHSGRTLSGGIDAEALREPKKFFGAARNTEEGGALTIIATALIETGSRMDEVIFEEFKGTGNMELVLDRELSNRGIYPAIDLNKSGTRKIELLLEEKKLMRVHILKRVLLEMNQIEAMELMLERMSRTKNNDEFLDTLNT
jgi:transcription termination factor Rho